MQRIWIALGATCLVIAGAGLLASACAGPPEVCRPVCEEVPEEESCRECLEKEEDRRADERRKQREQRRNDPPPPPSPYPRSGGRPGSY